MDTEIAALVYTNSNFDSMYGKILNFIHYEIEVGQLRNEFISYANTLGRGEAAEKIPASRIAIEASIAYCINRGAILPAKSIQRVLTLLDAVNMKAEEKAPDWEILSETARGKTITAYVDCYSRIDNAKTKIINSKLSSRELAPEIRKIINSFGAGKTAIVKQLLEHYKEAYSDSRSNDATKDWVKPIATIVDTISLMLNSKASVRAGAKGAKARKMKSTVHEVDRKGEKAATKMTYKEDDDKLGIRSVDPTNVVGANIVVIFNTKNRHCEMYIAKDGQTLSVKGASIINYDETLSIGKTVRKPEEDLPSWVKASTVKRITVLMGYIKGKAWDLTGKLNRNTVIIKVL